MLFRSPTSAVDRRLSPGDEGGGSRGKPRALRSFAAQTRLDLRQGPLAPDIGRGPKGPSNGDDADSNEDSDTAKPAASWFDATAVPSEEVFKKYFGTSAVGTYALPDAVHFRYLALPPAK